jgi:hypothetical protein
MRRHIETDFLRWAAEQGIVPGVHYPELVALDFSGAAQDKRFWCVPPKPERRPYFILSLLELMGDWRSCYVWRHSGSWPQNAAPGRINDRVDLRLLNAIGMPSGTLDIVEFDRDELDTLISLLFLTTIFGWSVGHDTYVVPDTARYILETDHHDVIHIQFRDRADVDRWVADMRDRGFDLPDDIPDETFKRPDWMRDDAV